MMDFIYETLEGGEELENFIIEKRLPHLRDPKIILPLWEDAIQSWDTKGQPELEQRKRLLFEWLTWMQESDVLVPPFTDLPIKFERNSAPPVDIQSYTTETIVKAIETKLRDKATKNLLEERLGGGEVLDEIDDGKYLEIEGDERDLEQDDGEWLEKELEENFISETVSTETLTPLTVGKVQDVTHCKRLKAGVQETLDNHHDPVANQVKVTDTWTFSCEEKTDLPAEIVTRKERFQREEKYFEPLN